MSVFVEDNKVRNLSTDARIVAEKPGFKIKFQNLPRKPRKKTIMFEKERLYDENLQLKQFSNSLQEENLKLKTRLLQIEQESKKPIERELNSSNLTTALKFQIKALKEKVEKVQSEYDELRASVKATRVTELEEEAKQYFNECWRLKKIIDEGLTGKPSGSSNHSKSDLLGKIREQSVEIEGLKSENTLLKSKYEKSIKEIQNIKNKLKSAQDELKTHKKISKNSNIKKDEVLESLTKPKKNKNAHEPPVAKAHKSFNDKDNSKNFNQSSGKSSLLILGRFFRDLADQLSKKCLSAEDFIKIIDPEETSTVNLVKLSTILLDNGFKFQENEMSSVFTSLSAQGPEISVYVILEHLEAGVNESSKNYGISSDPSVDNENTDKDLVVENTENVDFEQVEGIFDYLHVFLIYNSFSKLKFRKLLCDFLPNPFSFGNLNAFFLESECKIEEDTERNKICSYLLDNKESLEREAAVDKMIDLIYKDFPEIEEVKNERFWKILEEVKLKKQEFIKNCEEKDYNGKGCLSWSVIEIVLRGLLIDWDDIGMLQLKVNCFAFENSLNIIPYNNIFDLS